MIAGNAEQGVCGALPKNRINLQTPVEPPVRGAPLIGHEVSAAA
jgi:hypothetical protein